MALYLRRNELISFSLIHLRRIILRNVKNDKKDLTLPIDIDNFTTKLTQDKCLKWDLLKQAKKVSKRKLYNVNAESIDLKNITPSSLDSIINQQIEANDLKNINILIEKVVSLKCNIRFNNIKKLLSVSAQVGNEDQVKRLLELCRRHNCASSDQVEFLNIYLAEAIWVKGNVIESIKIFKNIYESIPALRCKLHIILDHLICVTTEECTEAILVQVKNFVEEISLVYGDYVPLMSLWQGCFLSEWFSNQCISLELLHSNEILRTNLSKRFILVVITALRCHRIEIVHRLFELLLQYEMREQYITISQLLFDYHCWQKDFRQCFEIIQWSTSLNFNLRPDQHERYLDLFLTHSSTKKTHQKPAKPPEFKFKF